MKRTIVFLPLFLGLSFAAVAAPEKKIDPSGQPAFQAGKDTGFYVWVDGRTLHLRWTAKDKPTLFTGSVVLSGGAGDIKRINALAGGWVDKKDENNVFFSATATTGLDGADIALLGGGTALLDVYIDGTVADVNMVNIGASNAHPKALPQKLTTK
jgi:hypothetical protein